MALLTRVREFIGDDEIVYECRRCGTTLGAGTETCPQCGESDIVVYEIV